MSAKAMERYKQIYSKHKRSEESKRARVKEWEDEEMMKLRSESVSDEEDDETCGIFCFGLGLILMFVGVAILATVIVYNQSDPSHNPVVALTSDRDVKPVSGELMAALENYDELVTISHIHSENVSRKLSLLVIVSSLPKSVNLRMSIRDTWKPHGEAINMEVVVIFSVAAKGILEKSRAALEEESRTNKDMVIFPECKNIPESEQLLSEWIWAVKEYNFEYILKVRDAMYVNLPLVMSEVVESLRARNSNAYLGYFEGNKDPNDSGKLDEPGWFLCDRFIRYAHSGGYIISDVLVKRLLRQGKYLHPYNNEDVAIGTWLSPFNDIDWVHEVRFDTELRHPRGCKNTNLIFETENHADMVVLHHKYLQHGRYCDFEFETIKTYRYDFNTLPSHCCGNTL